MKRMIKTYITLIVALVMCGVQNVNAKTDVYVFFDMSAPLGHIPININGKKFTSLDPEPKRTYEYEGQTHVSIYKMAMRKITFKREGTYVMDLLYGAGYKATVTLNIEDGQTQYVLVNGNVKRNFYGEVVSEKKGLKLLKKANGDKYTINKPVTYNGK